jgi:hypothetical protein
MLPAGGGSSDGSCCSDGNSGSSESCAAGSGGGEKGAWKLDSCSGEPAGGPAPLLEGLAHPPVEQVGGWWQRVQGRAATHGGHHHHHRYHAAVIRMNMLTAWVNNMPQLVTCQRLNCTPPHVMCNAVNCCSLGALARSLTHACHTATS